MSTCVWGRGERWRVPWLVLNWGPRLASPCGSGVATGCLPHAGTLGVGALLVEDGVGVTSPYSLTQHVQV